MVKSCGDCVYFEKGLDEYPCKICGNHLASGGKAHMMFYPREKSTVDHPTHYNAGAIECIEAIRSALTREEFRGFCKGNVLKYVWREKYKGGNEDLRKAEYYAKEAAK